MQWYVIASPAECVIALPDGVWNLEIHRYGFAPPGSGHMVATTVFRDDLLRRLRQMDAVR